MRPAEGSGAVHATQIDVPRVARRRHPNERATTGRRPDCDLGHTLESPPFGARTAPPTVRNRTITAGSSAAVTGRGTAIVAEARPTAWTSADLGSPAVWTLPVPGPVRDELLAAASDGAPITVDDPRPRGLPKAEELAREAARRLAEGPGFVVLSGFPVDAYEAVVQRAYWLFGLLLGRPVSQSRKGDLIGRVENRGSDIADPTRRGYESAAALPFHVDRTDVIGLLCVRSAASGGLSRLASSRTLHDVLAAEAPDLLAELCTPLPHDRRGEEAPGEAPWTQIPVFSRVDGRFAARYIRRFVEGSQRHEQAPRLTERQRAAFDAAEEILARPDVHLDMQLRPGDLQLVDNFTIVHARTEFSDEDLSRSRLLLRLWLAWPSSPPLPDSFADLYGATGGGTFRGGVWPDGPRHAATGRPVASLG